MIGSLQLKPSGRWWVVNEDCYNELTSGTPVKLLVARLGTWVSGRIEHEFKVGYVFWPSNEHSALFQGATMPLVAGMIADTLNGERW